MVLNYVKEIFDINIKRVGEDFYTLLKLVKWHHQ